MRENHLAQSHDARCAERMEAIEAFSDLENTLGGLADRVVSEEHQAKDELQISSGRTVHLSSATLRAAIAGILGFIEDPMTAFVTPDDRYGIPRTNKQSDAMLQDLVNKAIDDKLR